MQNYYLLLQINKNATQSEVRAAYHKMAKMYHPDNYKGDSEIAEKQMALINEAYAVLSDEQKRREYDFALEESEKFAEKTTHFSEPHTNKGQQNQNSDENDNNQFRTNEYAKKNNNETSEKFVSKIAEAICAICSKLFEWIVTIIIIYLVANHFGWIDRAMDFIKDFNVADITMNEEEKPEDVVMTYFKNVYRGDSEGAANLFSSKYETKYSPLTIKEYHEFIAELYYGIDISAPLYPLFEQIKNFEYEIENTTYNETKNQAEVRVHIQNCDIYSIEAEFEQSDELIDYLQEMNDAEIQEIVKKSIDRYKSSCIIEETATFVLDKEGGTWKIDYVTPLRDFSSVLVGRADELIVELNGKDPDEDDNDDSLSQSEDTESYDTDSLLW